MMEGMVSRAWMEISLSNLIHNYQVITKFLPEGCQCMAVVKADGYGHGAEKTALVLEKQGCGFFAVASLGEAVALRNAGVKAEILILGFTPVQDAPMLHQYNCIQTIVDIDHARALALLGIQLRTHLAIDTGMNRLGVNVRHREEILEILGMEFLDVEGIYSHMSMADGNSMEEQEFTNHQIAAFLELKDFLKEKGYEQLLFHMQSSYGMLNYSIKGMDYARIGILLFGCLSNDPEEECKLPVKPVLSLYSRVACVREVEAGSYISYGRSFQADRNMKIAVVAIGYADGLPRSLSGKGTAIVRGKKVPMIGRICMDQMMLDVSSVPQVQEGDVVTLIGETKEGRIQAVEVARQAGTITNELLSRMGGRLSRSIYLDAHI